jgi:hypothetical protein
LGLGANPSSITTWVLKGSKERKMFMSPFKVRHMIFLCTNVIALKYIARDPMGASKETLVHKRIWNLNSKATNLILNFGGSIKSPKGPPQKSILDSRCATRFKCMQCYSNKMCLKFQVYPIFFKV